MKQTNEIFVLPINTYELGSIDELKLYTSDKLISKYLSAIKTDKKGKIFYNEIAELVHNKTINPCWLNKGLFRLLKFKLIGGTDKMVQGFFYPPSNKIYILIDNNMILGYASNKRLTELTIHEALHLSASELKNKFLNLFESELTIYYSTMFKHAFNIPMTENIDSSSKKIYTYLFKKFELATPSNPMAILKNYTQLLVEEFGNKSENINEKIHLYILMIALFFKAGVMPIITNQSKFQPVISSLYDGYKSLASDGDLDTFCIQEMVYPSEVICIYSGFTKSLSKIKMALKKIN